MKRFRNLKLNQVIGVVLLMAALLFASQAFGASVSYPVSYAGPLDSVIIKVYAGFTLSDTDTLTSFPNDTTLALNNDSDYVITSIYYYTGEAEGLAAQEFVKFTGISDAEMSRIMDSIRAAGISTGTGLNNVRIYTIDTVAGDSIAGVTITINQMGGAQEANSKPPGTNSFGYADFTLPADSFEILAHLTGYFWRTDTIDVTGADTVDINGASIWGGPAPPTASNVSRVWGFLYDAQELALSFATVKFWLDEANLQDTCADVPIVPISVYTETNDTGYYQADLLFSDCMDKPRTEWKIKIEYTNELGEVVATKSHSFRIPADSVTYKLTF